MSQKPMNVGRCQLAREPIPGTLPPRCLLMHLFNDLYTPISAQLAWMSQFSCWTSLRFQQLPLTPPPPFPLPLQATHSSPGPLPPP